ncbi:MAG: hypothetical protein ACXWUG_27320 [Polyangiales bacterium]
MTLRLLERIHGHLGWLAVIALLHPAIVLRNPKRSARLSVALTLLLVTIVGSLGAWLYHPYSMQLRRDIYLASMRHGLLFERKEHLAFGAIALAWAGGVVHLLPQSAQGDPVARARFVHLTFVAAASIACVVAVMGTLVAAFRSF